jgi:hypothetical protein
MNLFQEIRQQAFYDELEKDASLKAKLVGAGMIGAMGLSGLGIGNLVGMVSGTQQANKGFQISRQEAPVSTKDFVHKYIPNMQVANQSYIDTASEFNKFTRPVYKEELKKGNIFYQTGKGNNNPGRIIAPDSASPTALSHEVGHHFERQAHPKWRPNIMRENDAWKMAPKVESQVGAQMKKKLFGSYAHQAGGKAGGLLGGTLLGGLFAGAMKRRGTFKYI